MHLHAATTYKMYFKTVYSVITLCTKYQMNALHIIIALLVGQHNMCFSHCIL